MTPRAAAAFVLCLCSCVGPALDARTYESKAAKAAEAVLSAVGTARFGIEAGARRRAPRAYTVTVAREAEDDAAAASGAFSAVQPPDDPSEAVRDDALALFESAIDALEAARIAL